MNRKNNTRFYLTRNKSPEYRIAVEHAFRSVLFGLMEQQIETNHSDQMETSSFVTDQFLTPVRNLIGYAIEAVQHGSIKTQKSQD